MPERKKTSRKKVRSLPAKRVTANQARAVKGGGKHIAGVKYEDITVNCGTGMSKTL